MNWLKFDEFVLPRVLEALWILAVIIGGILALLNLFWFFTRGWQYILDVLWILLGLIGMRVYFELMIIIFKIYDKL